LLSKDTSFGGISSADVCRSSGRPFVTTDIPPLRDALGVSNVILCRPGDAESLRAAIIRCFEDDDLVDRIYEESAVYCEANSIERYTDYFVNHALVWQTELD
jgi:glycosyltransferase involved in cell wall biosynthesis